MSFKILTSCVLSVILLQFTWVRCCERNTFNNSKIHASKYFRLVNDPDDIQLKEDVQITGCITPSDELKDAVKISITGQQVPVLYEGAVQDMELLHELHLENNGIKEIEPDAFQNLPAIATITLSSNKIEIIPEGVFGNMQVKRLLLNNNKIWDIAPKAFDNMPNLNKIDLSHNNLKEWKSDWFTNTPNIWRLEAGFNEITALPAGAFKNFKSKHEDFSKMPLITSIYLSNNKIEEIHPTAFQGLTQLESLDLDHNKIVELDSKVFSGFDSITNLWLDHNELKCWSRVFLGALPTTEDINLSENPLDCKCLQAMKKWARDHKVNMRTTIRTIQCMQERIENVLDSVKDIKGRQNMDVEMI